MMYIDNVICLTIIICTGMEGNCSRSSEMEGCSDSGKDSVRVVNANEEAEL